EIDPLSITPASVQLVGPITEGGSVIAGITGMTFRNDGRLYAISQDNDRLYTIDLTTAVATRIGTVDLTLHGGDITFDGIDRLWLWTNLGPGAGLYLVDPATTHASAFDLHPFLDMAGLTALGHGLRLRGGSQSTDRRYEIDTVVGLTGNDALLTLDGARFDFARGDLDSPYC